MSDFEGEVRVLKTRVPVIILNPDTGTMTSGGHGEQGNIQLSDDGGVVRASLHGESGALVLREQPPPGSFLGQEAVLLTAKGSRLWLDVAGIGKNRTCQQ